VSFAAYIGVDPGSPLSLALVSASGKLLATAGDDALAVKAGKGWHNSPELCGSIVRKWVEHYKTPPLVIIENVGPMPGEGIVSACKFVGSMWLMRGVASGLCLKVVLVTPQKWKKEMGLKGGVENKDLSRQQALSKWPDKAERFRYKYSHNIAEAALIAEWARTTKQGE
jgi:crossover junction endodeoxyribonuclease RuvC